MKADRINLIYKYIDIIDLFLVEDPSLSSDGEFTLKSNQKEVSIKDDCLQRELNYCNWSSEYSDRLSDQFLLFGGTVAKNLNDFLENPIENFEPSNPFYKQPPGINVSLEYVYGFLVSSYLFILYVLFLSRSYF
jgi:hypothetical protein